MKNYIQPGDILDLTVPEGGLASGQGVLVGALFGVATTSGQEGDRVAVSVSGVFELPKVQGSALAEGAKAYWNGAAITGAANGSTMVGHVTEHSATDAGTVRVRVSN